MGAENMAKKAAKRKNTRKNTCSRKNGGRNRLWIIFAGCCIALALAVAAVFQKPVRRHFSYPMEYEAEVRRACEKYDLDPCLVFAVIRTESFFTPDAVSGAGAQGLMQIMPETGEWIAWRQGKSMTKAASSPNQYCNPVRIFCFRHTLSPAAMRSIRPFRA